jgi:D-threonine aldolase
LKLIYNKNILTMEHWYEVEDIAQLDTPALVVFPDRVKKNIQKAIEMVGDTNRLRPHIKTNKSADAINLMLQVGISKFKCATIAEAELLGMCKASDVLLAYQPQGPKLQRFIEIIKKYPGTLYSCLTDNIANVTEQAKAFSKTGLTVPVYVDLNIGMNRTGIAAGHAAVELYQFITKQKGLVAAGIHAYDGHIRSIDMNERTKECNEGFKEVEEMVNVLQNQGVLVPTIISGGSVTFPIHAKRTNVQCSPGTFIYWDEGYRILCPEQSFLPAAVLVTRIISLPFTDNITTDLGHKSVAAENDIKKRIAFLNADTLTPVGQSEEHLVLKVSAEHSFKVGDVLYGLPYHICPTVALYERMPAIENGKVSGEWKNAARDRKINL